MFTALFPGLLSCLLISLSQSGCDGLKIGFLGDSGAKESGSNGMYAGAVFEMMNNSGVDVIVHNGDFDYEDSAAKWIAFLDKQASGKIILTASGNHEEEFGKAWYGESGYKAQLRHLIPSKVASRCYGEYGERYSCVQGSQDEHHFVMLGWRQTTGAAEIQSSVAFVDEAFKTHGQARWRWCVFHRPEGRLHPGDRHVGTYGLEPLYEVCRTHGAIITSGHSHVYGRTKLLSSFGPGDPIVSRKDDINPSVSCGATVAFVVGSSGFDLDRSGPARNKGFWRTALTKDDSGVPRAGALICDFGSGESTADCEYRLSNGDVIDAFTLSSDLMSTCFSSAAPSQVPAPAPRQCASGVASQSITQTISSATPGDPDSPQNEVSGMVLSTQVVNGLPVVWVVSDSGSMPQVVAYTIGGSRRERVARVDFGSSLARSWFDFEDLAIGPCTGSAESQTCLFIGDIGNNEGRASSGAKGDSINYIYRIPEPALPKQILSVYKVALQADHIPFRYVQGGVNSADAETLLSDPWTGDLFVVTKWDAHDLEKTRLFRIPAGARSGVTLDLLPENVLNPALRSHTWTRGDISKDGTMIALGDYSESLFWPRIPGMSVAEALGGSNPCEKALRVPSYEQHETIAFGLSRDEILQCSEGQDPDIWLSKLTYPVPTSTPTTLRPTTLSPTPKPTPFPTGRPTKPTRTPTFKPTIKPTGKPTARPTRVPTILPTQERKPSCTGPYSAQFAECESRIMWMTENWDKVSWKDVYVKSGVDGSRCSIQIYLASREGYCPACACDPPGLYELDIVATEDAEESEQGSAYLDSSDLELGFDAYNGNSDQLVCMRFDNLPSGQVEVVGARVVFTAKDSNSSPPPQLECFGEDSAGPAPFSRSSYNLSSRSRTVLSVSWNPVSWEKGSKYATPELLPLLPSRSSPSIVLCCRKEPFPSSPPLSVRTAFSSESPSLSLRPLLRLRLVSA